MLQVSAGQAAERKYRDTLRRAGVDEDFVVRKSSGTGQLNEDDLDVEDNCATGSYRYMSAHSDSESDHGSYTRSYHSQRSQSRTQSAVQDYSDDFDQEEDGEGTGKEGSDFEDEM